MADPGHANPAIAEIFSCSTVHSLGDKLWTLPLLLKLSRCSILSHIYKSVCIPTVKQTGDSCIATVPGRGWEQREKQSGSEGRAGTSGCEQFGMSPELQSCVGKRPQSREQGCGAAGGSGWAAGSSRLNWGLSHIEGRCLLMNVRLERILASVQTGHVMVVCTCSPLLSLSDSL